MAVDVIFTIASRSLRIFGSGTSTTSTFCLPIQQLAFIQSSLGLSRTRRARSIEPRVGYDDVAGFNDLLEREQLIERELLGMVVPDLRDDRRDRPRLLVGAKQ